MCDVQEVPREVLQAFGPSEPLLSVTDTLNFEPYMEFREQIPSSYDLLIVSRGAAHQPVYAIGASLNALDDSEIVSVEHDPEIPIRCDKAYQLLFNWKLKVRDGATWVHLGECLKKLRDESMVNRIERHLLRLKNPEQGSEILRSALSDNCKQLENVELSELDLLCVSVKAANHSVAVVGACFALSDELVTQVIGDSRIPNRQRRIYMMLLHWESQPGVHSTWSTLMEHLASLEDEMLSEGVKDYMEDKVRCDQTAKSGLVAHFVQPQQETGPPGPTPMAGAQSVPSTSSTPAVSGTQEAGELVDHPQEESSFDRYHSLMVASRTVPYQMSSYGSLHGIRQEVGMLETELNDLQDMLCESLQRNNVPVNRVRRYISSLSVSRRENIPRFNKHMKEMFGCLSFEDLFSCLERLGSWCILNFLMIEEIIHKFANEDHELKEKLKQFQDKVNAFKATTNLSQFLEVWSGRQFYDRDSEGRIAVIIKLQTKWCDCTISEVAEKESFLANAFDLHQSLFRLSNAQPGCVAVMWLVPHSVLTAVQKVIKERLPDLWESNIQELIVGNLLFVRDGVVLEPVSYPHLYKYSIDHPEEFWGERAKKFLVWDKPFTRVMGDDPTQWFTGGKLNVTRSVLDRHVKESPDRVALIWETNEPQKKTEKPICVTYRELYEMTCRVANVLKSNGIAKGDVVTIYMPVMPLTVACMLACARIGAIHSVIFAAVKGKPLKYRLEKAKPEAVITATTAKVGDKELCLKANIDEVLESGECKVKVFVASSPESQLSQLADLSSATAVSSDIPPGSLKLWDIDLQKEMASMSPECEPVSMDSEDSLFLAFTSGSSADPKMITHSHAGYLLYTAFTHKYVFDYQPGDVFACVVDLAWITGHSYVVYGPLCNGATTVLFSSTASYPNPGRYWDMVDRLKINQLYTSASAIKGLMKAGDEFVRKYDRSSLRTIGSVGEPLHGDIWKWYQNVVGQMQCVLVDTWWQTEVGGIAIAPLPVHEDRVLKPGFTMKPFFGVQPVIVNDQMQEVGPDCEGNLCLRTALPGMGQEVDRRRENFQSTYYQEGLYQTFDLAYCDKDGDFCIKGRVRDRIGTDLQGGWLNVQEIEHVMTMLDKRVKEALLVAYDSKDTQEKKTCAFVEFQKDPAVNRKEERHVVEKMRKEFTSAAGARKGLIVPDKFVVVDQQPKTYSHKAQRYLLRQIASEIEDSDEYTHPAGDTTTNDYLYTYEVWRAGEDCPDCSVLAY